MDTVWLILEKPVFTDKHEILLPEPNFKLKLCSYGSKRLSIRPTKK